MGDVRKLYNPDLKERFITQAVSAKASQNAYRYVLSKAYNQESRLDKDLCRFQQDEYDLVLTDLEAKSQSSIQYQHSILENYITFGIQNGFGNSKNQPNYASNFSVEMLSKCLDKITTNNQIISKDDLDDIVDLCENEQDAAPIILMYFVGISGDMEEIRNLQMKDIDRIKGVLTLTRFNGDQREIPMEDKYLVVLEDAYKREKYIKNNGERNAKAHSFEFELENTGYVLRNVKRKDNSCDQMTAQAIRQRLRKIAAFWDSTFITPTSMMISGMVEYTKQYMLKHNKELDKLESSDYKEICRRFGIDEKNWFTNKKRILQHFKS